MKKREEISFVMWVFLFLVCTVPPVLLFVGVQLPSLHDEGHYYHQGPECKELSVYWFWGGNIALGFIFLPLLWSLLRDYKLPEDSFWKKLKERIKREFFSSDSVFTIVVLLSLLVIAAAIGISYLNGRVTNLSFWLGAGGFVVMFVTIQMYERWKKTKTPSP